jgi:hypothetical protein
MTSLHESVRTLSRRWSSALGVAPESDEYLSRVQAWRDAWRPPQVKVLLIAESHVRERAGDSRVTVDLAVLGGTATASGFCRLVYCMAYGDDELCRPSAPGTNAGTPPFWRMFDRIAAANMDGALLSLAKGQPELRRAVQLRLLGHLRTLGVWLVDASVVGIARPQPDEPIVRRGSKYDQLLQESWTECVYPTIRDEKPEHVWVVGSGVNAALAGRIWFDVPVEFMPQPGRFSQRAHDEALKPLLASLPWAVPS